MKLFTTENIRAIERETITAEGITAHTLVERVANAAASVRLALVEAVSNITGLGRNQISVLKRN